MSLNKIRFGILNIIYSQDRFSFTRHFPKKYELNSVSGFKFPTTASFNQDFSSFAQNSFLLQKDHREDSLLAGQRWAWERCSCHLDGGAQHRNMDFTKNIGGTVTKISLEVDGYLVVASNLFSFLQLWE